MNNQLRAAELLRQAAAALSHTGTTGDPSTPHQPTPHQPTPSCTASYQSSSTTIQAAVRNAFLPYSRYSRAGSTSGKAVEATSSWTHRFCVLSSTTQVSMKYLCSKGFKFSQCVYWSKDFQASEIH